MEQKKPKVKVCRKCGDEFETLGKFRLCNMCRIHFKPRKLIRKGERNQ